MHAFRVYCFCLHYMMMLEMVVIIVTEILLDWLPVQWTALDCVIIDYLLRYRKSLLHQGRENNYNNIRTSGPDELLCHHEFVVLVFSYESPLYSYHYFL